MSFRKTILSLAKEKEVPLETLAKAMKYSHVNSLYRGLNDPKNISYNRVKGLAKSLGMSVCELTDILK